MKYVNEIGLKKAIIKTKELIETERNRIDTLNNNMNNLLNPFIISQGKDMVIQNTGDTRFKNIKIKGDSYQEGIPTTKNPSEIKSIFGNVSLIINNNLETSNNNYQEQLFTMPLEEKQKLLNKSYFADDGIHHKRRQIILDGTENWGKDTNTDDEVDYFYTFNTGITQDNVDTVVCTHFTKTAVRLNEGFWATSIFCITINKEMTGIINTDTKEERIEKFKTWLTKQKENGFPVIVEYETNEEIVEEYTAEQKQVYDNIKKARSYKGSTHIFSTNDIKPNLEVEVCSDIAMLLYINELLDTEIGNVVSILDVINGEVV